MTPLATAAAAPEAAQLARTLLSTHKDGIPVETGFTWTSAFTGGTFVTVFVGIMFLVLRQVGPWRKQTTDATDKLIQQLSDRLAVVENGREADRRMHYIQVARLEARHAAQRQLDRHKFNNADANLDALLRILEVSPEKAPEAARQAREARAQQRKDELLEAAEIQKAELQAVARAERELEEAAAAERPREKGRDD